MAVRDVDAVRSRCCSAVRQPTPSSASVFLCCTVSVLEEVSLDNQRIKLSRGHVLRYCRGVAVGKAVSAYFRAQLHTLSDLASRTALVNG